MSTYNPFMPELCWAVSKEDSVMCGYPEKYEIKVYTSEGNVIKRVVKDYKPVKITQEEIEEKKKRLPGPMKLNIPQYHSAYRDFTCDEENRIEEFSFKLKNCRNFYRILDGSFIFP